MCDNCKEKKRQGELGRERIGSPLIEGIPHIPRGVQCHFGRQTILGFHSRGETAMLVYKTMAKRRSSFA